MSDTLKQPKLGDRCKSLVHGFAGVATSYHEPFAGAPQFGIQPPAGEDGKLPEAWTIDVSTLEVIEETNIPVIAPDPEHQAMPLGAVYEDGVTGLVGVAICRHTYITGCTLLTIQPPAKKNKTPPAKTISAMTLTQVVDEEHPVPEQPSERRAPGGPGDRLTGTSIPNTRA